MSPTAPVNQAGQPNHSEKNKINGFTIDRQNNVAFKIIKSSDGTKEFKLQVPLSNTKDQKALYEALSVFSEDFCAKSADLCIKMKLGEKKEGKSHTLNKLSLNINSDNSDIESMTKGYEGGKTSKVVNLANYQNKEKSDSYKNDPRKLTSVQGKITAYLELNEILTYDAKKPIKGPKKPRPSSTSSPNPLAQKEPVKETSRETAQEISREERARRRLMGYDNQHQLPSLEAVVPSLEAVVKAPENKIEKNKPLPATPKVETNSNEKPIPPKKIKRVVKEASIQSNSTIENNSGFLTSSEANEKINELIKQDESYSESE